MSAPCDQVEDFFDGELSPSQADSYREHAATCEKCQRELTKLAQLQVLETQYRPELEERARTLSLVGQAPRRPFQVRWRGAMSGAAAALAAMLAVWFAWSNLLDRVPDSTFYPAGSYRLADGRSAHPRARAYRPLAQAVLGPEEHVAPSFDALGKLERAGDLLGVAAARLSRGTARDADDALELLEGVGPSPDVLSELSFAHLVRGDVTLGDSEEALRLADQALARDSRHGPALWNRALALKALGLHLGAARAFDEAAALGEPGWSLEARTRAGELRAVTAAGRRTWYATIEAGKELVATGAQPSQDLLGVPLLRHYFYDAVRSRASKAEVERLLPLAREMDARAGDTALQDYVAWVASRSFAARGPLAAEYRRLAMDDQTVDTAALLRQLRKSEESDLLLGVLKKLPQVERHLDEMDAIARGVAKDPWLSSLALIGKAEVQDANGHVPEARAALEAALQICLQSRLDYRCAEIEDVLAFSYSRATELEQADAHARRGLAAAGRAQAWSQQKQLVLDLAQLSRLREDYPVSRAYYEEALERDGGDSLETQRYAHEGVATIDVRLLRFDEARRHINAALATGRPLNIPGAHVIADLARVKPDPERDAAAMEAFRTRLPELKAGPLALAEHALGRWELERDRQKGEALLRSAIQHATAGGLALTDQEARRALAYSYTSLIFDAGKRGDAEAALRLFEEEWLSGARGELPGRCLMAIAADDERVLAVVRGAAGGPASVMYDAGRREPLPKNLSGLMPLDVLSRLSGCPKVEVLARAPIYGRPGLLPRDVAWSYRGAVPLQAASPAGGAQRHLVVQDVALSPTRRPLRTPQHWDVPQVQAVALEQLTRQEATPQVVLHRMEDAADITFITHALVQKESEEAFLVLSPDSTGNDALRAADVQKARLRAHPLVVLASCQGAQPAPVLHEARSLPAAFLRAGARAVFAASDTVPERDGPEFFGAVRARIHAGTAPAEALRAERAAWVAQGRGARWLDGVLLFE